MASGVKPARWRLTDVSLLVWQGDEGTQALTAPLTCPLVASGRTARPLPRSAPRAAASPSGCRSAAAVQATTTHMIQWAASLPLRRPAARRGGRNRQAPHAQASHHRASPGPGRLSPLRSHGPDRGHLRPTQPRLGVASAQKRRNSGRHRQRKSPSRGTRCEENVSQVLRQAARKARLVFRVVGPAAFPTRGR